MGVESASFSQLGWVLMLGHSPFLFLSFLICNMGQINFCAGERQGCCSYQQEMTFFLTVKSTSWGCSWVILTDLLWWAAGWGGKPHSALGSLLSTCLGHAKVGHAKALQTYLQGLFSAVLETGLSIPLSLQGEGFCVCVSSVALCLPKIMCCFFTES